MPTRACVLLSQVCGLPAHSVTWFSRALPHQTLKNQGVSRLGSAAVNNDHVGWALPPLRRSPSAVLRTGRRAPAAAPPHRHANRCFRGRETPVLTTALGHPRPPPGPAETAAQMPKPKSALQPRLPWSTSLSSLAPPPSPYGPKVKVVVPSGYPPALPPASQGCLGSRVLQGTHPECMCRFTASPQKRARVLGNFQATLEPQRRAPFTCSRTIGNVSLSSSLCPPCGKPLPCGTPRSPQPSQYRPAFSLHPPQVSEGPARSALAAVD